jgi:ATP-dependent Lon protease
MSTLSQF